MPWSSVLCLKEPGVDNLVPDWSTVLFHDRQGGAYSRKEWEPGEIVAMWHNERHRVTGTGGLRFAYPDLIWVWTSGGRIPVSLQHCTWDGR